jgi:hypothetical protein
MTARRCNFSTWKVRARQNTNRVVTASGNFWTQLDPRSACTDSIRVRRFPWRSRVRRTGTLTVSWFSVLRASVGATTQASPSPQRAEVRHAEVTSRRSVALAGPLDLSAQDEVASALRTATPKYVFERIGGCCSSRCYSIRFEEVLAREPDRGRPERPRHAG